MFTFKSDFNDATTLSKTTFRLMTLSLLTFRIMTVSLMTFRTIVECCYAVSFMMTVVYAEIHILAHYAKCHYPECHYAECCYAGSRGTILYHNIQDRLRLSISFDIFMYDNEALLPTRWQYQSQV